MATTDVHRLIQDSDLDQTVTDIFIITGNDPDELRKPRRIPLDPPQTLRQALSILESQ